MCVVSMVIDQGRQLWPLTPQPGITWPTIIPNTIPTTIPSLPTVSPSIAPDVTTLKPFEEWAKMLKAAKNIDDLTGQPDCEDPAKVEWVDNLCDRLVAIGTELIKDTEKSSLGVELIQLAKEIKDTLDLS